MAPCKGCGQLEGIEEYDNMLWDLYSRAELGGRQYIEPFVYTQDDLHELGFYDDEDTRDSVMTSMERNMMERGLCGACGRPDLRGVKEEDIMSKEDARELNDMYAEMAAERRMGC